MTFRNITDRDSRANARNLRRDMAELIEKVYDDISKYNTDDFSLLKYADLLPQFGVAQLSAHGIHSNWDDPNDDDNYVVAVNNTLSNPPSAEDNTGSIEPVELTIDTDIVSSIPTSTSNIRVTTHEYRGRSKEISSSSESKAVTTAKERARSKSTSNRNASSSNESVSVTPAKGLKKKHYTASTQASRDSELIELLKDKKKSLENTNTKLLSELKTANDKIAEKDKIIDGLNRELLRLKSTPVQYVPRSPCEPILDSLTSEILELTMSPCGYPNYKIIISPDGTFKGTPDEIIKDAVCITYSSLIRLAQYGEFLQAQSGKNTSLELRLTLATFRTQFKSWWDSDRKSRQPICHVVMPMVINFNSINAVVNIPFAIVATGINDIVDSGDIDVWYHEKAGTNTQAKFTMKASGDTAFLALLALKATKADGYFSGIPKKYTFEHRVEIPDNLVVTHTPVANVNLFWIAPAIYVKSEPMPNHYNFRIENFTPILTSVPTLTRETLKLFYTVFDRFITYRNNYITPRANIKRGATSNPALEVKNFEKKNKTNSNYPPLNPIEVISSDSYFDLYDKLDYNLSDSKQTPTQNNSINSTMNYYQNHPPINANKNEYNTQIPAMRDNYAPSYNNNQDNYHSDTQDKGFNSTMNYHHSHPTPASNKKEYDIHALTTGEYDGPGYNYNPDTKHQSTDSEIQDITRRLKFLTSTVVQKHKNPVTDILTTDERSPHPIGKGTDPSKTSEYYYNNTSDSRKWTVVTGTYDHLYTYDLVGLQVTIGGVLVDMSEALQIAVNLGVPIVGPLTPNRSQDNNHRNKDYSGNNYDDSSYPHMSSSKSKTTERHCFDPNNIGEAKETLIKAVVRVIPTWIKGQQINHIHGRAILEFLLNECFDLSKPDSKAAHQLLLDLKTVHTHPYAWNIALAALMTKYFSEQARTTAQNTFTTHVQKLDETFEAYVRNMLKLGEGPFSHLPVFVAQTIMANAVTTGYVRKLITTWQKLKPNHWSTWQSMFLELTQTIVPEGITEYALTLPTEYPLYPEKGKDYHRHGYLKKPITNNNAYPPKQGYVKPTSLSNKKPLYSEKCAICGMNNHTTAKHNEGEKQKQEVAKGNNNKQPAACYTCGGTDHMKPDCPKNKQPVAAAPSAKTTGKDDKALTVYTPVKGSAKPASTKTQPD
jgi:hypothetical protein